MLTATLTRILSVSGVPHSIHFLVSIACLLLRKEVAKRIYDYLRERLAILYLGSSVNVLIKVAIFLLKL